MQRPCAHTPQGALLLKHGRHGRPKVHYFRVTGCDTLLRWRSASGSMKQVGASGAALLPASWAGRARDVCGTGTGQPRVEGCSHACTSLRRALQVKLRSVNAVVAGQGSEVFRRHPVREAPGATRSLSLHYKDEEGAARTLDLTCANREQFELWHAGLRVLAHRLRTVGAPVAAAAGGAAGTMPPLGSASGTGGATPADVARCLDKSRALQVGCRLSLAQPTVQDLHWPWSACTCMPEPT